MVAGLLRVHCAQIGLSNCRDCASSFNDSVHALLVSEVRIVVD